MIPLNINFLKSQPTVGELRKVTREAQSPINLTKGDKFVARQEIKHPQVCDKVFVTSFQEEVSGEQLSSSLHNSLMPRTLNYSKLNQARTNLNVQSAFKDLGIEVL